MSYRIVEYYAENFKRLRLVDFKPTGRVTVFTGKNDQGKTSALDAIPYVLAGKKFAPELPMRRGAKSLKVRLDLGEIVVQRTQSGLTVTPAPGVKAWDTPQAMLDSIFDELSFDPMEFTKLEPKDQAEMLRRAVTLEVDIEALAEANTKDYDSRRIINRDIDQLTAQAAGIAVIGNQAPARIDVTEIEQRIAEANEKNRNLAATIQKRAELERAVAMAENAILRNNTTIHDIVDQGQKLGDDSELELKKLEILKANTPYLADFMTNFTATDSLTTEILEQVSRAHDRLIRARSELQESIQQTARCLEQAAKALQAAREIMPSLQEDLANAQRLLEAAPTAEMMDTAPFMEQLRRANETNRAADAWDYRQQILDKKKDKETESRRLTRCMEERDETKRRAIANAKMPVEGLSFDEAGVYVDDVPIAQLGEARQIKIGISIVLARNPKLRLIRIPHGESLDDDTLVELANMAEEKDFYIWMAKVDTSGKVGIYLEDGEVKAVNQ